MLRYLSQFLSKKLSVFFNIVLDAHGVCIIWSITVIVGIVTRSKIKRLALIC